MPSHFVGDVDWQYSTSLSVAFELVGESSFAGFGQCDVTQGNDFRRNGRREWGHEAGVSFCSKMY